MNQTAEARHAAAAERELQAIYRSTSRKAKTKKPAIHPLMNTEEVCRLFGFQKTTLSRRIESGRLPPACNKAISAPANLIAREMWQRDHRRWNRKLLEALSWGILPPVIHTFQGPQDWIDWLTNYKDFA